jgi:hypothetical protein
VAYRDRVPRSTNSNPGGRILVSGVTGSGKSTAAQRIAARTWLPLTLADELTWAPGWVPVAEDEQRRLFAAVVAQERWVLDTAYGAWLDVVLPRVDLVVGLDYPRWFSLQRVFRRSVMKVGTAEQADVRGLATSADLEGPECPAGTSTSCLRDVFRGCSNVRSQLTLCSLPRSRIALGRGIHQRSSIGLH